MVEEGSSATQLAGRSSCFPVEYCYPPLDKHDGAVSDAADVSLPAEWRHLPSFALPDGAHNFHRDAVFFVLPSRDTPRRAVYGVSCYRQIAAAELVTKAADVTRSTVQKGVCVLATVPMFGLLKAKLELITAAYFNERDFGKVQVLADMYSNLCATVTPEAIESQILLDISVRDLVKSFRHRVLILFKLFLLEKRVLFQALPVHRLCQLLLTVTSLFPGLLERGLASAFVDESASAHSVRRSATARADDDSDADLLDDLDAALHATDAATGSGEAALVTSVYEHIGRVGAKLGGIVGPSRAVNSADLADVELAAEVTEPDAASLLDTDSWGFPLSIFAQGALWQPYLPLAELDSLQSAGVRSYAFGATNALFAQRRQLLDAIVSLSDEGDGQIELLDGDLRKQLALTTADLRFADALVQTVGDDERDTCWQGGDEWLRLQLRAYLLSLVASERRADGSVVDFGVDFVSAWRRTRNFGVWRDGAPADLDNATPGHPFCGQLNVSDMRLRLGHSIDSSEQAKKLSAAVSQTGKYIGQTGKSVKSALSGWLSDVLPSAQQNRHPSTDSHNELA